MKNKTLLIKALVLALSLIINNQLQSQCDTILIDRAEWSILDFDSEETVGEGDNNGRAINCIDNDLNTFWHTKWKNFESSYPHFISIDMGEIFPINGISIVSRGDSPNNKPKNIEVYFSNDGIDWGQIQVNEDFIYPDINASGSTAEIYFGAVYARFFKIVFNSNYSNDPHIVIAELYAYQLNGGDDCVPTGQNNQVLIFEPLGLHYNTDEPFELVAYTNTSLPVTFEVTSGSATVEKNILSFTGDSGIVKIKAFQEGNEQYYPIEKTQSFKVVDLSSIEPEIYTSLTEEVPLLMPKLMTYPIYAYANIDFEDVLDIQDIKFYVNDKIIKSKEIDNLYYANWTPDDWGIHTIKIVATGSNGVESEITKQIDVSNDIEDLYIQTLNDAVIDMGTIGSQWYYGTYTLPQFVGAFKSISAYLDVSCPDVPGGCDDWDRLGYFQIKDKNGKWVELFRYITPFGKGCSHSIDVTDYQSLLQGEVEFRVYIETWGTGGWQFDLYLDYTKGEPTYNYSLLEEVWIGNFDLGNPANLLSVPIKTIYSKQNVKQQKLRIVTTGHNWGKNNSQNAAEFYYSNNIFKVNGVDTFTQYLFTECNPNPDNCTAQHGTWKYNRAGWYPGSNSKPYFYDLSDFIEDDSLTLQYIFDPDYVDYCHPNNPDCVSGVTCPNCNDGYNPYYRVGGYVVYFSDDVINPAGKNESEIITDENIVLEVLPNPNKGAFRINLNAQLEDISLVIYNISGQALKTYYFENTNQLTQKTFNIFDLANGMYFIKLYSNEKHASAKFTIN